MIATRKKQIRQNTSIMGLLDGLKIPAILLDKALNILQYSSLVPDFISISKEDIGTPFVNVTYVSKFQQIGIEARNVLNTKTPYQTIIEIHALRHVFVNITPFSGAFSNQDEILVTFSSEVNNDIPMTSETGVTTQPPVVIKEIAPDDNLYRKAFEEASTDLMNSNRLLSKIEALGKIGTWIYMPETNYLNGSVEALRIFGLTGNEGLTLEIIKKCIQEDMQKDLMGLIQESKPFDNVYNVKPADGSPKRTVRTIAYRDFDNEKIIIVGTIVDITNEKEAEAKIEQTRNNYQTFFNTIDDMLFVLDEQGIMIHVNETVCTRLGYTSEEIIGQSVYMINPPEEREEAAQVLAEMLSGKRANCTIDTITKTGTRIPVETKVYKGFWDGIPAIFGISKDVSALTLSEEIFSKIFHLNPSACGFTDIDTEKYLEVNKAFYDLLGYEENEIIGKNPLEVGLMTMNELIGIQSQIPAGTTKMPRLEATLTAKNGDKKFVQLGAEDFTIKGVRYRYTVVNDMTDYKNAMMELHELNSTLEQRIQSRTSQLETTVKELEAFSYSLSHDLRAPLRAINGFSSALIEDYNAHLDETAKTYLNRMAGSAERMSQLIDDLLNLSVITRKEIEIDKIDVKTLACGIKDTMNSQNNVSVEIEDNLIISGDYGLVRIALENLIGNAMKYSAQASEPMIKIGLIKKKGKEYIFIKDNGVGFNMEYVSKLFMPFQRLHSDADFTGSGIGLAIVWRIVNKHGGDIWAESVVGEGATFYVRFER
jgi:PAS domain S-box-containing protein